MLHWWWYASIPLTFNFFSPKPSTSEVGFDTSGHYTTHFKFSISWEEGRIICNGNILMDLFWSYNWSYMRDCECRIKFHGQNPAILFRGKTLCLDTMWGPTNAVGIINYPLDKAVADQAGEYMSRVHCTNWSNRDKVIRASWADFLPEPAAAADNSNGRATNCQSWWIWKSLRENTSWGLLWLYLAQTHRLKRET